MECTLTFFTESTLADSKDFSNNWKSNESESHLPEFNNLQTKTKRYFIFDMSLGIVALEASSLNFGMR